MDLNSTDMPLSATAEATPIEEAMAPVSHGWLDAVKERFSGQEPWAIELVLFGLGGFVAGFLIKNFGKIAALITAGVIVAVLILHYTHLYDMPFEKVKSFLGIAPMSNFNDLLSVHFAWAKEHPVALASGLVGLFVGWKVG